MPATVSQAILNFISTRYTPQEYPALSQQIADWQASQPLKGISLLDGTPLFTNTLVKYVPLLAAGASLSVAVSDTIPYDASLLPLLASWGIPIVSNAHGGSYDIILDCGGTYDTVKPNIGCIELTRSGYYHYRDCPYPVILVDDSRTKTIETCLGTGDGFLRGMKAFGFNDFRHKNIVIFGYGKVGRGVAYYCLREGANVTAIDISKPANLPETISFIAAEHRQALQEALRNAWCVVTATGIKHALHGNGAADILNHGNQLIAAIGIEDEWGDDIPTSRRLADGRAVNFLLDEPTRLRYIDATMALSNAAALELLKGNAPAGISRISVDIEAYYWHAVEAAGLITSEIQGLAL